MIDGIDVSNWQNGIGWGAVAASGVQFAIVKASEGTGYADPYFSANWSGMRLAGIARGAYHFSRPEEGPPEPDCDWFLALVTPVLEVGDVVALDLESGYGDLLDWTLRWLRRAEGALGFKPLLYTSASFIQAHGLQGNAELATFGAWLASWDVPSETLHVPPAWEMWAVHQHTDSGTVPGIAGGVDCNRFNGTIEQFKLYGKPGSVNVPTVDRAPLDHLWATIEQTQPGYPLANGHFEHMKADVSAVKSVYNIDP